MFFFAIFAKKTKIDFFGVILNHEANTIAYMWIQHMVQALSHEGVYDEIDSSPF